MRISKRQSGDGGSGRVLSPVRRLRVKEFVLAVTAAIGWFGCEGDSAPGRPPLPTPVWSQHPQWSPDGSTIAYFRNDYSGNDIGVWTIRADGSDRHLVIVGDTPAWSADGSSIAISRSGYIYICDADGTNLRQIKEWSSCYFPTWSPDGRNLAFNRTSPRDSAGTWIVDLAGERAPYRLDLGDVLGEMPDWSPDGSRIALGGYDGSGGRNLYVWSIPEQKLRRLTNQRGEEGYPRWAPDGRRIAYTTDSGIRVIDADTGADHAVPGTDQVGLSAWQTSDWSPDGRTIVYSRQVLWLTDPAGTHHQRLERD